MSKAILNWKCDACGDAENCDASCVLTVFAGEPTVCPVSEDDCEWRPAESNEAASKSTAECRKDCDVAEQRRKLDNQNTDLQAEIDTFAAWRGRLEKQAKMDNYVTGDAVKRADQFQDENEELRRKWGIAEAEVGALLKKYRWIPVTERLPEEKGYINVANAKLKIPQTWYWTNTNAEVRRLKAFMTHWQPIILPKK